MRTNTNTNTNTKYTCDTDTCQTHYGQTGPTLRLCCPHDRGCGHVPNALRANRAYATRLGQRHHTIIPPDQNWIEILNAYVVPSCAPCTFCICICICICTICLFRKKSTSDSIVACVLVARARALPLCASCQSWRARRCRRRLAHDILSDPTARGACDDPLQTRPQLRRASPASR